MEPDESEPGRTTMIGAEREEGMGGLAKGLSIIESFTRQQPKLSVSQAAVASGTTPAAARRCLRTLESLGYVTYDGKYYRPTPRMLRLPGSYVECDPLPVLAGPRLTALREKFDESACLAVLDGDETLFVGRSESSHIASTGMRIGSRLTALGSAAGRVLIASLPDDEIDRRLSAYRPQRTTDQTLTSIAAIRDRIRAIQANGFDYNDQEFEVGVRAIAVPVVDVKGEHHAAMTMNALAARVSLETMQRDFLPELRAEAARLGAML